MSGAIQTELWTDACERLRSRLGSDSFTRFFDGARLEACDEGRALITVPSDFQQWWIESNLLDELRNAVSCDGLQREVRLQVAGAGSPNGGALPTAHPLPVADKPAPIRSTSNERYRRRVVEAGLKPEYVFGSFVIGTNNRFAQAAAMSVAKAPGDNYNPLFLHGGVGLGKTHLMQAIGHKLLRRERRVRVLYLPGEQFANEFIEAIRRNSLTPFRERYRRADVLLLDDVQFLAGKERSQEEFFHTFNALLDGQKQIVLTSDRPANEIKNLEPRLVSRFEWGLTAELQPPDEETRVAILRKKAEEWGVSVGDEVVHFIAGGIRNNIRRLEGALTRLATYASLSGEKITGGLCERLLRDFLQEEKRSVISIDSIQRRVAEHYDVRLADMASKRRPAHIAFPRQVAMYLARKMTSASLAEIGESFGGRDHGTVLHACKRVEERMQGDPVLRLGIARLQDELSRG